LFSYGFAGGNQETLPKIQGNIPKTFQILAKKLKHLIKTQGYETIWAYWASKKCTKNKPGLRSNSKNYEDLVFQPDVAGLRKLRSNLHVRRREKQKSGLFLLTTIAASNQNLI